MEKELHTKAKHPCGKVMRAAGHSPLPQRMRQRPRRGIEGSSQGGCGSGQGTEFCITHILSMLRVGAMTLGGRSFQFIARPFGHLATRGALTVPMTDARIRGRLTGFKRGMRRPGAIRRVRNLFVVRGDSEDGAVLQRNWAHNLCIWWYPRAQPGTASPIGVARRSFRAEAQSSVRK